MANKKITDATTATSVSGTDKVFLNQGGDLKQVDLNSAVANSQAVQTLNSNLVKRTVFSLTINVEKGKEYTTRIDYSSIKGSLLFSDITWSNSSSDIPIYVNKYRDLSNGCIRSCNHSWNITQSVTFVIVVLYI